MGMGGPYRTNARVCVEHAIPARVIACWLIPAAILHAAFATVLGAVPREVVEYVPAPAPPRPSVFHADPITRTVRDEKRKALERKPFPVMHPRPAKCRMLDGTIVPKCDPGDSLCTCE